MYIFFRVTGFWLKLLRPVPMYYGEREELGPLAQDEPIIIHSVQRQHLEKAFIGGSLGKKHLFYPQSQVSPVLCKTKTLL